ncbi:3-beta hydroxysteroid dehydrogenase/isomerase family [Apiospora kogelbergensis]|uniref:3-beta hydroxysteroid dehydrogenase/isomerase family n=1 Tax=Apiospora kogelbergensis TaxID=1337665 RepID=UPI00313172E7
MEWLKAHLLASAASVVLVLAVLYLWKLNRALTATPPEVLALSPHRWTEQEIRATYARLEREPLCWAAHLPPARPGRRYVVVGGSGGVGGQLILHLLERGQPPSPSATRVDFVQADITDAASVDAAFAKPWPRGDSKSGLTVFHTAAMIVPNERAEATYDRVARVNVGGTRHVLEAARRAGASVLVATSSASTGIRPVGYLSMWPWQRWPRNYVQALDEADFDQPLRPHDEYFGNYAHAKAVAERLVCGANTPTFRTGAIRPANGIYGSSVGDQLVGLCLRSGTSCPSWTPNIIQNLVHATHVSIGHLLFEAALLDHGDEQGNDMPGCAGRPFCITDPNPPPAFRDIYNVCMTLAVTPSEVQMLQPVPMLLLAYVIELCDTLARQLPGLFGWVRPRGQIALLQPATFSVATHTPATDAAAQKPVAEGGLGYRGVYTTLEGVCQQVLDWNREHTGEGEARESSNGGLGGKVNALVNDVQHAAAMPAAVGA